MEFEWDDAKSEQCFRRRGFAFASMVPAFADPHRRVEIDDRRDYGETRYRLFGCVSGRLFAIVYTMRGDAFRIISARKANVDETRRYGQGSDQG